MLPFLSKNKEGSASSPVEHQLRESDEGSDYDSLESAAHDVLQAIETKNRKALAAALRAAFEICDSEPHLEGEHNG